MDNELHLQISDYIVVFSDCGLAEYDGCTQEIWTKNGIVDRIGGPARIYRNLWTGVAEREEYLRDGRLHRTDGPAVVLRNQSTAEIIGLEYYENGQKVTPPDAAGPPTP
jgi:hypothetical protein